MIFWCFHRNNRERSPVKAQALSRTSFVIRNTYWGDVGIDHHDKIKEIYRYKKSDVRFPSSDLLTSKKLTKMLDIGKYALYNSKA